MKQLSPDYRITQEDFQRGQKLFEKEFVDGQRLKAQEIHFQELLLDAEQMYRHTGQYPTVQDVLDNWKQQAEAQERRRIANWRSDYVFTEKDFTTLAEEDSGPIFEFVNTAKHLKAKAGLYPTVAQVRAEMKRNEKSL